MSIRLPELPPAAHAVGGSLFARYAYPPNALGYCGPDDAGEVLAYASGGAADAGLAARAREFTGAWPYLELIAAANGVRDPLDPRIVRAYWLGERPAAGVTLSSLAGHVDQRFRHRSGNGWGHVAAALRPGAIPDHAFHVLAVYPWVGLLREGVAEPARTVVESCCIRPARVVAVTEAAATVEVPTLAWDGSGLHLAGPEQRTVHWRHGGARLVRHLEPGDAVAIHWDWVCERLHERSAARLRARLIERLAATRW